MKLQKKKLQISEGADPNYLAVVIKCENIEKHPNADKLEIITVFGNSIIVAKDQYKIGEKLIYFPVESCISGDFLSWANLYSNPICNSDGKTKSYFEKNNRVRAISLRGVPSQGFLYKVSELVKFYHETESNFNIGDTFDVVGDHVLVTNYIKGSEKGSGEQNVKKSRVPKWLEKTVAILPRPMRRVAYLCVNSWFNSKESGIKSRIVEGQFKFHYKTPQLGQNLYLLNPNDFIIISEKLHGASGIYSNIKCKKYFNPFRKIFNQFGMNIPDTEYKFIYSSRQIIKNRKDGKYTEDIWGIVAKELDGKIPENIILYGELVGWSSQNGNIQKNYDYSITRGNCDFKVYRGVENTLHGGRELDWYEIEEICYDMGIVTVPVHYIGFAKDLFNIEVNDSWRDNFLIQLKTRFFNDNCVFCKNNVVNEGVVLRIESSPNKTTLKFKNPLFLLKETKERDNEESNIEEEN